MAFEKGHKLAKGGKRPGAGRPSRAEVAALGKAKQRLQRIIASNSDILAARYLHFTGVDPPTCRHAVDKLWPNEQQEGTVTVIEINTNINWPGRTDGEIVDDGRIKITIDPTLRPDTPAIDVTPEEEAAEVEGKLIQDLKGDLNSRDEP
jgi:hypothetical protein